MRKAHVDPFLISCAALSALEPAQTEWTSWGTKPAHLHTLLCQNNLLLLPNEDCTGETTMAALCPQLLTNF